MSEVIIKSLDVKKFHIISIEEPKHVLEMLKDHIHRTCPNLMFVIMNKPISVDSTVDIKESLDYFLESQVAAFGISNMSLKQDNKKDDCCKN